MNILQLCRSESNTILTKYHLKPLMPRSSFSFLLVHGSGLRDPILVNISAQELDLTYSQKDAFSVSIASSMFSIVVCDSICFRMTEVNEFPEFWSSPFSSTTRT